MSDGERLLNERHERCENETTQEIQKKKSGKEENRACSDSERFGYGA
jgi:hypothetical protein